MHKVCISTFQVNSCQHYQPQLSSLLRWLAGGLPKRKFSFKNKCNFFWFKGMKQSKEDQNKVKYYTLFSSYLFCTI